MNFYSLLFIVGLLCACSNDSSSLAPEVEQETEQGDPTAPLEVESLSDISYGTSTEQVFDIHLPANRSADTKILILLHGGGWSSGDKEAMNPLKDFIKGQLPDFAVVNMNYRLADENNLPYPMQVDDITSVVNLLKERSDDYQIGAELGLIGVSAGGHLALLWSYAFDVEDKVKMVCSVVGPTNLMDPAYQNSDDETVRSLIEQFGPNNEILTEASPLHRLDDDAPPTILFYGGQDPLIPVSQGIDLDAKLGDMGIDHEFTLYQNEGHGWVGPNLLDTSLKLKAFIEKRL